MCVSEAGGDDEALIRVVFHPDDGFVAVEEAEAGGDDVDKIRLHRHDGAEAPENPEDDLLQLEHAPSIASGSEGWGRSVSGYPPAGVAFALVLQRLGNFRPPHLWAETCGIWRWLTPLPLVGRGWGVGGC